MLYQLNLLDQPSPWAKRVKAVFDDTQFSEVWLSKKLILILCMNPGWKKLLRVLGNSIQCSHKLRTYCNLALSLIVISTYPAFFSFKHLDFDLAHIP